MQGGIAIIDWGLLCLLALLWGGTFPLTELALADYGPLTMVAGRVSSALLVMLVYAKLIGLKLPRDWATWRAFAVMGLLNGFIPNALIFYAQESITGGLASILNATSPLFSIVIGFLLGREPLSWARIMGLIVGFLGVGVLASPTTALGPGSGLAMSASLAAAFCYGCGAQWSRRFADLPPFLPAIGQVGITAFLAVPASLILEKGEFLKPPGVGAAALLVMGVGSTALAFGIYYRLLKRIGGTNALLVTFLMPPTALLLGFFFLNEEVTSASIVGLGLILSGIAAIDGRVFRLFRRPAAVQLENPSTSDMR